MSYSSRSSLGDTADVAKAIVKVTQDPHLPEVTCHVLRLSAMEEGRAPGPPCAPVSLKTSPGVGIGLRHAVVPVRIAVKVREKPWIAIGFIAAVTASVFALGVAFGRRRTA